MLKYSCRRDKNVKVSGVENGAEWMENVEAWRLSEKKPLYLIQWSRHDYQLLNGTTESCILKREKRKTVYEPFIFLPFLFYSSLLSLLFPKYSTDTFLIFISSQSFLLSSHLSLFITYLTSSLRLTKLNVNMLEKGRKRKRKQAIVE